ncbi:GNAT family N-acetyltransferase [Spirosoma knui]
MHIEPYKSSHLNAIIDLSLRAWEPVFDSLEKVIDPELYQQFYPNDWQVSQQEAVEATCKAADVKVWVATDAEEVVSFVAVKIHADSNMGEIYMIAVDPAYQLRGIGKSLMENTLDWMKTAGVLIAMVETGADPGHAPARNTYEKLGFKLLPVARYFKKL